jgi:NAD(P)-dependent dehydrogenase (short-subunit alcohol dehydrogenase family)
MKDFAGKIAVVTGGASGIGRALGTRLARAGMKVVLADVEAAALAKSTDEVARATGADVAGIVCDVTRFESVEALASQVAARHGRVHVLCNNAGVGAQEDAPLWELPLSDWRWTFAVNVWGVIHGIKAFVPGMLAHGEEGHVVNTSSGNGGLVLVPGTPIYSASKAAVSSITETLHLQLVKQKARLHAHVLYPGPHIVSSNIFDARRNRPVEFTREVPQQAPPITLDTIRSLAKLGGVELQTTTPEEVAENAFQGLLDDAYFILSSTPESEARVRERFENVLQRRNPVPPPF